MTKGNFLITFSLAMTTALCLMGNQDLLFNAYGYHFLLLSKLVMLWSATLASLAILTVIRAHSLEFLFGGLDNAVIIHRKLGIAAIGMMLAHVVLLSLDAYTNGRSVGELLVPFWSSTTRSADILVFYFILLLGILAYNKKMRYEPWLRFHRTIGILFLIGTFHASIEPGTINSYEPLRTWIVFLLFIGLFSWGYRIYFFRKFGPCFKYKLLSIEQRNDKIVDLIMDPIERRMMYIPGNFVFIAIPEFNDKKNELHPFSISSSPTERKLRLSINQVGDFTKQLSSLIEKVDQGSGSVVDVYGPFGSFTLHRFAPYRRMVWIGAGIGITPFLSMLRFEISNEDFRRIWLYYVVKTEDDAVYDKEISENYLQTNSYIDYKLWTSKSEGRLTAKKVVEEVELEDYAVMLCGTKAFVEDMRKQFTALGFSSDRIIIEELQFRSV